MINPKELRIGNYVQDSEGVLGVIRLVASDLVYVNHFDGYAIIDPIFGSELNPIPLSEEWLVKFGFEELPKTTQHHADMKSNYHCPVLWLNEYTYLASNAKTPTGYLFLNNYRIDCKYVHQLQNLYFALTGKELTIATADPQQ